jgi:hypothetical protein
LRASLFTNVAWPIHVRCGDASFSADPSFSRRGVTKPSAFFHFFSRMRAICHLRRSPSLLSGVVPSRFV